MATALFIAPLIPPNTHWLLILSLYKHYSAIGLSRLLDQNVNIIDERRKWPGVILYRIVCRLTNLLCSTESKNVKHVNAFGLIYF